MPVRHRVGRPEEARAHQAGVPRQGRDDADWTKLAGLPEARTFLREGITLEDLQALATALTDVQAAEELNEARLALFRRIPARVG